MSAFLSDAMVAHLRDVADAPELPGTRYEPVRRIGRGGMAVVWLARDTELDRDVALKVEAGAGGGDEGARMAREARILARLEHPGIAAVHEIGRLADGRFFYAMQLVRGETLEQRAPSLALNERIRVLLRVCDAVAYAHAHGIIHRDLKPANVMLGAFGEVLVMDWGVAKVTGEADVPAILAAGPGTEAGTRIGTPGWMAPEQERGDVDAVDARTDVFGLGGLLRFLLADDGPPPKPLAAIRDRALARDPADRYHAAEALADDLRRFLDGAPVSAHSETPFERLGRVIGNYRTPIILVLTYLLLRAVLLLFSGP